LLAQGRRKFFRDDAGDYIGWTTSGEANHHSHRMFGVMPHFA
jgi:hypothetical protein